MALPTPIFGAMLAIWHLRPALQRQFHLERNRPEDYLKMLAWCTYTGRKQYVILREIPEWDAALNQPISLPDIQGDTWGKGFTVGMFLLGIARQRYSVSAMLTNARARHFLSIWYWRGGRHEHFMPPPPPWQLSWIGHRFASTHDFCEVLRRPKLDQGKSTAQMAEEFRLEAAEAPKPCAASPTPPPVMVTSTRPGWWRQALGRLPRWVVHGLRIVRHALHLSPGPEVIERITRRIPSEVRQKSRVWGEFGVNLFGYARGELGIGEDLRMVSRALKHAGVPFCIINVHPGEKVSQMDASMDDWHCHKPRYAINLFCMTGVEQVRFFCEQGAALFRDRYTIGLWPWELPAWPRTWFHAFNTVNEIWGISQYTAQAYRDAPVPVRNVPLAVNVSPVAHLDRAHFGLPAETYLFIFAFDLNSTMGRKNPEGVVKAFQRAFPRGSGRDVGLIIKISHANDKNPRWRKLKARILADPRVHLIERMMRRQELLALYQCCDCFVSLHRAEGFGRGIAEALLMNKQVICTGFSGNLDFCTPQRVNLVHYHLRPLDKKEYFYPHGQSWAEPSISHAADLMCQVIDSPLPTENPGFDFGFAATGRAYKKRLQEIYRQYSS